MAGNDAMTWFALTILGVASAAIIVMAWRKQREVWKESEELAKLGRETDNPEIDDLWNDRREGH